MNELKSIMESNVIIVRKDTSIYKAVEALKKYNITALPVVDEEGIIAGIISEKDVLKLIYSQTDINATVEDYMTKEIIAFRETADILEVCECLINNHFRRVPIVTEDGKIAGIVSRKDIIKYILEPIKTAGTAPIQR